MIIEPTAELNPARAERDRIVAASLTSALSRPTRLVLWATAEAAEAAAAIGEQFTISIEDLSERSGLPIGLVSDRVSDLMTLGWIVRTAAGQWQPTVPALGPGA